MTRSKEVYVDIAALEALPDTCPGAKAMKFTPEQDAAVLKYWPIKNHQDVARTLGMSTNTVLRRYRELTQKT